MAVTYSFIIPVTLYQEILLYGHKCPSIIQSDFIRQPRVLHVASLHYSDDIQDDISSLSRIASLYLYYIMQGDFIIRSQVFLQEKTFRKAYVSMRGIGMFRLKLKIVGEPL